MAHIIALPSLGEYGCYVGYYVRRVQALCKENRVVVCCPPGDRWLFPEAYDYWHDYDRDFLPDRYRCGTACQGVYEADRQVAGYLELLGRLICTKHIGFTALRIHFGGWDTSLKLAEPPLRVPLMDVGFPDRYVCLGVRHRAVGTRRNIPEGVWVDVCDVLRHHDIKVVLLGRDTSSLALRHPAVVADTYSVKPELLDRACASFLARSLGFVGSDSGLAHLADITRTASFLISNGEDAARDFLLFNRPSSCFGTQSGVTDELPLWLSSVEAI